MFLVYLVDFFLYLFILQLNFSYLLSNMWNKDIPYNDLPLLPRDFDYDQTEFLKLAITATWKLEKLNGLIYLLPNKNILISPLLIKESVESSAIENINTTTIKVLQSKALWDKTISGPEKEVLYYQEAILYGYEQVRKYGGIPTNLIVKLQEIIEPNKSWVRKIPGTVISNWYETIYTPPEWEQVIWWLLSNLEKFMHTFDDNIESLVKLPMIHHQFESIHPFYDGNGRVWRIINILYLVVAGKLDFPVLFLSEYINRSKSRYYKLLNETTKTNNYTDFIIYILEWIILQADISNTKILKIYTLMKDIEKRMKALNLDYHTITEVLFSHPFISIKWFQEILWVSRMTAVRKIEKLEQAKIISSEKIWKNKLIYIPEFIDLLW